MAGNQISRKHRGCFSLTCVAGGPRWTRSGEPCCFPRGAPCIPPSLFCRKLLLKETSFLKESAGHMAANASAVSRCERGTRAAGGAVPGYLGLELTRLPGRPWSWRAGGGRGSRTPGVRGCHWWLPLTRAGAGSLGAQQGAASSAVSRMGDGNTVSHTGAAQRHPLQGALTSGTGHSAPAGQNRPPAPTRAGRPAERWVPAPRTMG